MKNTKIFFALVFATFAFSGLIGMEEDGFYVGSDEDGPPPLEKVVSDGNGGYVLQEEVPSPEEVEAAKTIISENVIAIQDRLKNKVPKFNEGRAKNKQKANSLLGYLVNKTLNFAKKNPNLFQQISDGLLESKDIKVFVSDLIQTTILPQLSPVAKELIKHAPDIWQQIKENPEKVAAIILKVGGLTALGYLFWHFGIINQGDLTTLLNTMMGSENGTALEL